jgi:hypothetical protein
MTLRACATKEPGMTDTAAWTEHSKAYKAYIDEITSDDAHDRRWRTALVPVVETLQVSNITLADILFAPSERSKETPSTPSSKSKPYRKRLSRSPESDVPPVPPLPGTAL